MAAITIDPLSMVSLSLELSDNGKKFGTATGFIVERNGRTYLVTNWHVVTGLNPITRATRSGALTTHLQIWHHSQNNVGSWTCVEEPVRDLQGRPLWLEHSSGSQVDVVLLPLQNLPSGIKTYPLDLRLGIVPIAIFPAFVIQVIGFPLGFSAGGKFPIWKTGHIASEPELDFAGLPVFLIDATTREGMSGAPVVSRVYGAYQTTNRSIVMNAGSATRFLGIYSGRLHEDSEVGHVWKPRVIDEIFSHNSVP